ncbi:restriction endonuclease subunit S [Streptomyces sp. NPDC005951]|uniref:restriction endonuclease subunit S n=1 Tax=Streptomyces sp. NPDC005951 TaxID=3154573 RepID=UPI0033F3C864
MTLGLGLDSDSADGGEELPGGPSRELPPGWAWATLKELCDVNPRAFDDDPGDDDFISQVPMASVEAETGRIDASNHVRYGDLKKKSLTRFQENDVLFAKITPCMENGKITVARGLLDGRALGSTEFHVLRSCGAVLPEYLMHYLLQRDVRVKAEQNMSGAVGQRRVPRPYLESLEIPVPPLPEQRRIVGEIEQQISRIEAGETAIASAIERQLPLRESLLDHYVLGLAQERDADSLKSLNERQGKKIDYRSIIPLPRGWSWRIAQDACTLITSGSTPQSSLMYADSGEIPFLKVYNISKRGFVDFSIRPTFVDKETHEGSLKRSRVTPGDVLTNIVGPPLGKSAVVPNEYPAWNINQAIVAFRAGPDISPAWLRYVLQAPYVIGLLTETARATAGQFNIALSTCRELPIPVPPRDVQEDLCGALAKSLAEFDSQHASVEALVRQSAGLRAALLHAAFTGALVPQNPADEPASALLDRIRAARLTAKAAPRKRAPRKPRPAPPGQGELPE